MLGLVTFDQGRREDKSGTVDVSILLRREDEAKVSVLASAKVALNGHRVLRQELVGLRYCGVVRISG